MFPSGTLWAHQAPSEPTRRDPSSLIQKGDSELGLLAGGGIAHAIWGGRGDRQFVTLGGRLGRVLTGPVGPGLLKGNFEVSVELLPVFVMLQEETTYALSVTLLFRHYLAPGSRMKPFVSFGAGSLFSGKEIPPGTTSLNFTPQAGLGIAVFVKERLSYQLEYRIHHISNASLATPNPGVNSSYFQFGVSVFR